MFTLSALDRPAQNLLTQAARQAHGTLFASFKSANEADAIAQRCGLESEIDPEGLRRLMHDSRNCHWCAKSLGQKLTACFTHRLPLAMGGDNCVENTVVACLQCARARVALTASQPTPPGGAGLKDDAAGQHAADCGSFHRGWVYVAQGAGDSPWIFLAWGEAGYVDRLQHLKYTSPSGAVDFRTALEPFSAFRGLVVRSADVALGMLREVNRAGKVSILPS